jgi:hypothetical protein
VALLLAGLWMPASVGAAPQTSTARATLLHGEPGECAETGTGAASGTVMLHRNAARGTVTVQVQIRDAVPGATYFVAITCVEAVGEIVIARNGSGHGMFTVPSAEVPPSFRVNLAQVADSRDPFFTGLINLP